MFAQFNKFIFTSSASESSCSSSTASSPFPASISSTTQVLIWLDSRTLENCSAPPEPLDTWFNISTQYRSSFHHRLHTAHLSSIRFKTFQQIFFSSVGFCVCGVPFLLPDRPALVIPTFTTTHAFLLSFIKMLRNGILIPPFRSFFHPTESSPPYNPVPQPPFFNVSSATSALMLTTAVPFSWLTSALSTPASASNAFFYACLTVSTHHSFDIHCLCHRYSLPYLYYFLTPHFLHFF